MIKRLQSFLAITLITISSVTAQEANQAARDFLQNLRQIDPSLFGTTELIVAMGGQRIGKMTFGVEQAEGEELYRVIATMKMSFGEAQNSRAELDALVDPSLRVIRSKDLEYEMKGGTEVRTEKKIKLDAGIYSYSENENGKIRNFTIKDRPGFVTGGGGAMLHMVLARLGTPETTYVFLTQDEEEVNLFEMRVGSVSVDGLIWVKGKKTKRNKETGEMGTETMAFLCRRSTGHVVEIKIKGAPLQIAVAERLKTPTTQERPEIVPVLSYFRGITKQDREMVRNAVDWEAVWNAYKNSPAGRARMANLDPAQVQAAGRQFAQGVLNEVVSQKLPPEAVMVFTSPGSWEVVEGSGHTTVRLTQSLRESNEKLDFLKYMVSKSETGAWRIVRLPGL